MTTLKLVGVAVLCGAFTGLRGGLFSLVMWRLNVRIRQELFKSLLAQEVGFYDTSQTGVCLLITLDTDNHSLSQQPQACLWRYNAQACWGGFSVWDLRWPSRWPIHCSLVAAQRSSAARAVQIIVSAGSWLL